MTRRPRHRLLTHFLLLAVFAMAIGALLRDHATLPVGKISTHIPVHKQGVYEGINHLSQATTPFLRTGAAESIWWFAWQKEALVSAKLLGRPIMLYSGAAWSKTCAFLDTTHFVDPEVVALINSSVIPVRVDREARPDVDTRYRLAARVIGGGMNDALVVFLTPAGEIFFAADAATDEGDPWHELPTIIESVARFYQHKHEDVEATAHNLHGQLKAYFLTDFPGRGLPDLDVVQRFFRESASRFDMTHGGFRDQVGKWPDPATMSLYLRLGFELDQPAARRMALLGLRQLAVSGIHDHLHGGFHRGARDAAWRYPYFGKRLRLNAQLLRLFTDAYAETHEPLFQDVAAGIIQFATRVLRREEGGVFAATQFVSMEEATWTAAEMNAVLSGPPQQVAALLFDIKSDATRNALVRTRSPAEVAKRLGWNQADVIHQFQRAREQMAEQRAEENQLALDESVYAEGNGAMIAALFRAGSIFSAPQSIQMAQEALETWLRHGFDAHGFHHRLGEKPHRYFVEDQAAMLGALLEAYDATTDHRWLQRAEAIAQVIEKEFGAALLAGFFDRPVRDDASVLGMVADPYRPYFDLIGRPSNPTLAALFDRLYYLTGDTEWRTVADGVLLGIAGMLQEQPNRSLSTLTNAILHHHRPPPQVVLVGERETPQLVALEEATRASGGMAHMIQVASPRSMRGLPSFAQHALADQPTTAAGIALVCRETCSPPVSSPERLMQLLHWSPPLDQ